MPAWRCPNCQDGTLTLIFESLKLYPTAEIEKLSELTQYWLPEWDVHRFFMKMKCVNCNDPVLCIGITKAVEEYDYEFDGMFPDTLVPTYFEPAVPVIFIPLKCPESVRSEVLTASSLIWCSPSSAGNKIRAAVERLMDAQGVPNARTLHDRIKDYASTHQDVADKLLAIKWIGNTGSHSDNLELVDVLDAFELLEYCLDEIYEGRAARLKALAASINTHKGPPPK
jgi:hypothetical protein